MPSATEKKSATLDAKKEEFRKYLETEGVLEYLATHLIPLYEASDNSTSAIEYLKHSFVGNEIKEYKEKADSLQSENKDLKKTIENLEDEKTILTSTVTELEIQLAETSTNTKMDGLAKIAEDANDKIEEKQILDKDSVAEVPLKSTQPEDEPMESEKNEVTSYSQVPTKEESVKPVEATTSDKKPDEFSKESQDDTAAIQSSSQKVPITQEEKPRVDEKTDKGEINTDETMTDSDKVEEAKVDNDHTDAMDTATTDEDKAEVEKPMEEEKVEGNAINEDPPSVVEGKAENDNAKVEEGNDIKEEKISEDKIEEEKKANA